MTERTAEQELALAFVDALVPGRFEDARRMLDPSCEYAFDGEVLRGDAIIAAFEKSHEDALKKLDRIEYLPGQVFGIEGLVVVVRVFDRLELGGRTHTYSDRLAVTIDTQRPRPIVRVEHRPFAEERARLTAFLGGARSEDG